jgi:hypothetical protein
MWAAAALAAAQALSAIGNWQSSKKQAAIEKEKLDLARQQMQIDNFWNQKNYNNQVQTFNENLADKYRGRGSYEQGDIHAYDKEYQAAKLNQINGSDIPGVY